MHYDVSGDWQTSRSWSQYQSRGQVCVELCQMSLYFDTILD